MTTSRQFADSEGDFKGWQDHPEPCKLVSIDGGADGVCGCKVKYRSWESSDGAYEDYQYRCENGHVWWIDGIDS